MDYRDLFPVIFINAEISPLITSRFELRIRPHNLVHYSKNTALCCCLYIPCHRIFSDKRR